MYLSDHRPSRRLNPFLLSLLDVEREATCLFEVRTEWEEWNLLESPKEVNIEGLLSERK